jgi:hypothetical protein
MCSRPPLITTEPDCTTVNFNSLVRFEPRPQIRIDVNGFGFWISWQEENLNRRIPKTLGKPTERKVLTSDGVEGVAIETSTPP